MAWGRRDAARRARQRAAEERRERNRESRRHFIQGAATAIQIGLNVYSGQVDPVQTSATAFDTFSDMREENLSQERTNAIEQATYLNGLPQTSDGYDEI
jgi:hypothetical protein